MSRPLYALAAQYTALLERLDEGEAVDEAQLEALVGSVEEKGAGLVHVLAQLDADDAQLKAEIDRLLARKRAVTSHRERLREYVKRTLSDHQITRLKAGTFSIALGEGPPSVVVDDESKIPEDYVRTKITKEPNKAAILEAYKAHGEVVPGVHIERSLTLRIR